MTARGNAILAVLVAVGLLGIGCEDTDHGRGALQTEASAKRLIDQAAQLREAMASRQRDNQEQAVSDARLTEEQNDLRNRIQRELDDMTANLTDIQQQQGSAANDDGTTRDLEKRRDKLTCDLDTIDVIAPDKWATFKSRVSQDLDTFRESTRTASSHQSAGPRDNGNSSKGTRTSPQQGAPQPPPAGTGSPGGMGTSMPGGTGTNPSGTSTGSPNGTNGSNP